MKFVVKVCGKDVLMDEAQVVTLVEVLGGVELFTTNKYVGHNKGTYGANMEYTDVIEEKPIHDWVDLRPMDMNLYKTLKLVTKLEK